MTVLFEYRPVTLDAGYGDTEGMLVFRNGRLLAVVTRLGDLHVGLAGAWFIEAVFNGAVGHPREPFADLASLETWLSRALG